MGGSSKSDPSGDARERATYHTKKYGRYCKQLLLCLAYIVTSGGLIRFNSMLMQKDHFPHALALSALQMLACCVFCSSLYVVAPSMFPGMENNKGQRLSLMKWFVPIGCLFAVVLFCSNQAYMYCSVTFLQFMKESNVMIVFVFSCVLGLQSFGRLRCVVILCVIVGASVSISGEVHFRWLGFTFQVLSQVSEVMRMLMGEIVLNGRKLDPLTYNMLLAPICLLVLIAANGVHWSHGTLVDLARWWPLIIGNACLAVCLNVAVAAVIKECSAVGFVLAGLLKDIAIVIFSATVFNERVTQRQAISFVVTILGVFFWSYMKIDPTAPAVRFMEWVLCVEPAAAAPTEKSALLDEERPSLAEKRV